MIFGKLFQFGPSKKEWHKRQSRVLLRMLVPKNNEKTPLAAEQMFAAIHGVYKAGERFQATLGFEIATVSKFINFYVSCPKYLKEFIEGQIYAQYPTVEIEEVGDYTTPKELPFACAELVTTKQDYFPIKTFANFEVDPLAGITGVLSELEEGEEIWIQLLVEPLPDDWQKKSISFVSNVRRGRSQEPIGRLLLKHGVRAASVLIESATSPSTTGKATAPESKVELPSSLEAALKATDEKATKLGYLSKVRIIVFSKTPASAYAKANLVVGAFKQFNTTNMNGLGVKTITSIPKFLEDYRDRFIGDGGYILNIEEIASLYHLPNVSVETPTIVWAGSKKGEPPANLPTESQDGENITFFGTTNFRRLVKKFGIKLADRGLHMYAIGKTGTGKTTLLENMIINDIHKGRGVAVVDPHGDLIRKIINFIPNERVNDVVFFSPADRDFPIAFNVLENVDPDLKNIVASGVVGIFKKIFGESWGPRLEYILRNTILALLEYPNATMLGITRILTDPIYRRKVVENVTDPVIKDFFINEFEKYDQKFRVEAVAPIQNKVGQFLSSTTIRNIVGQPKSTIDIAKLMDEQKILLLDLSIGKIGEDNSALLGAMLITKIQLAAMGRAVMPESERIPFYLYVDEFQNFATDSFAVMLSEARKYKLNLIMTNQYIAQMPETVANAIFGNVGTIICFRVGAGDSTFLEKEVAPIFTANDLVNLDNFIIYSKMAINGVTSTPFSARTLPPATNPNNNAQKIIKISRERYSRKREFVETKIKEWADYDTASLTLEATAPPVEREVLETPQGKIRIRKMQGKVESESGGKTNWFLAKKLS